MDVVTTKPAPVFAALDRFDADEFLRRAEIIGRIGEADAMEMDAQCRATDRLVQALRDAQVPDLWKPRRYGGIGADIRSYCDFVGVLAKHSMVASWLAYFYSIHEVWVGYMPPEGREEIFGSGGLVADVLAPVGQAERDGNGYRLSGQWNFASGVPHSEWVGLGAVTSLPDGDGPEYCVFAVRVNECEIIENWDTLGMRGTGSHGVRLERVFVPSRRILPAARVLSTGQPVGGGHDPQEPIYRMPFLPFFAGFFPAVALGGAQRMVEEFRRRTEGRVRVFLGGTSATGSSVMPAVLGELSMRLEGIQGLMNRYCDQLEQWLAEGKTVNSDEEKARMYALRAHIARGAVEIVVEAGQALGGTALYRGDPVELYTRDLLTLGAHSSHLYVDAMATYGGARFGGPAHPVW